MAKILLADGNAKIRLLTKSLLQTRQGLQVSEAVDGDDAVAKASELKPDLVVLDFAMPGLNGLQAAHRISTSFPDLPIILYPFYGFPAMLAEAKKHGIREVVDKAANSEYLLGAIEKQLSKIAPSFELPAGLLTTDTSNEEEPPKAN